MALSWAVAHKRWVVRWYLRAPDFVEAFKHTKNFMTNTKSKKSKSGET